MNKLSNLQKFKQCYKGTKFVLGRRERLLNRKIKNIDKEIVEEGFVDEIYSKNIDEYVSERLNAELGDKNEMDLKLGIIYDEFVAEAQELKTFDSLNDNDFFERLSDSSKDEYLSLQNDVDKTCYLMNLKAEMRDEHVKKMNISKESHASQLSKIREYEEEFNKTKVAYESTIESNNQNKATRLEYENELNSIKETETISFTAATKVALTKTMGLVKNKFGKFLTHEKIEENQKVTDLNAEASNEEVLNETKEAKPSTQYYDLQKEIRELKKENMDLKVEKNIALSESKEREVASEKSNSETVAVYEQKIEEMTSSYEEKIAMLSSEIGDLKRVMAEFSQAVRNMAVGHEFDVTVNGEATKIHENELDKNASKEVLEAIPLDDMQKEEIDVMEFEEATF